MTANSKGTHGGAAKTAKTGKRTASAATTATRTGQAKRTVAESRRVIDRSVRAGATTKTTARRPVSKISVSLPDDVTAQVRGRVGPGRVSAYITAAVERALEMDRLRDLVEDLDAEHGPVSADARAAAEAAWPDAP